MPSPILNERRDADYTPPTAILECIIERVTFHNEENGYAVIKVLPADSKAKAKGDVITVLGSFTNPVVGESLRCHGSWIKHPQWGSQFKMERYEVLRPATAAAIEKYLGSGMVKGIGPKMAERIVKKFGENALDIIEQKPEKLLAVSGLGEKRIEMIRKAWDEQKEVRSIMLFLQGHGVSPTYAVKIYRFYKDRAIEVVEKNPFQLATDIWGIGFKSADKIALNLGFAPDDPRRLEAGIVYVLNQEMEGGGHCYLPREKLIGKASEILLPKTAPEGDEPADPAIALRAVAIEQSVDSLIERELLVSETVDDNGIYETGIYVPSIFKTEKLLAERINQLLRPALRTPLKSREIDAVVNDLPGYEKLSEEQQGAVRRALSEQILVLTGGPGTGKCVRGDTLVLANDGLYPVEEHWGTHQRVPDSFCKYSRPILAKDRVADTSHIYYGGLKDTLQVQTHLGLVLEGTPNHRIWAMTETGPAWVRLDQLKPEMYVAIRRGDNHWGNEPISPDVAYLFGVLCGDGGLTPERSVAITNNDLVLLERCRQILCDNFGLSGKITPSRSTFNLRVHSLPLRKRFAEMGLGWEKAATKQVPIAVRRGSRDAIVGFLSGLMDTDGHVSRRSATEPAIEFISKSKQLIQQVQLLLLNLNIVSRITEKRVNYTYRDRPTEVRVYYRLTIYGADADGFLDIIPTKKTVDRDKRNHNTNKDIVPLPGNIIREIFVSGGRHSRREWWQWKREIKGQRHATRGRLLAMLAECRHTAPLTSVWAVEEACRPCYFWDPVVSVTPAKSEVFDLTVPGDESFIANGFVNHNTTTTKTIVAAFEKLGKRLQIASPTGRAAKRAAEVTGKEAKTIHRLLVWDPEKRAFKAGPGEPLELDVLVVDESSMLDLVLTHHTLQAVPNGAQVIFVGDIDQLPSVGPGNVLNDLIISGRVPVARLTQVFRQAAASKIITNAHAINKGKMPDLLPPSAAKEGADCVFLEVEDSQDIPDKIAGVVAKSLPRLGFSADDITVLAPMQRGTVGAKHLNEVLQGVLNPPDPSKPEHQRGPITFRVGDRVMQRVNNYDKNVYNGDVGKILDISKDDQTLVVQYPEQEVEYDFPDIDQLTHAFVCTIHKSQGSEYPACIIAIHTQHYTMLQRNLIYTGLTRAKKMAVFVGAKRAIQMAVNNRNVVPRWTRLAERIQMLAESLGPNNRPRIRPNADSSGQLPTPPMPGRLF